MIALVAIISKRMIALMATSYWKTLKTLQKPGRKTCLKLLVGTCLNLAKLLFGGGDQNLANFFFKNV
jgi:hypothetical protein